ncbi:hypothetical protein CupriaWKF_22790 [Cupriavidus sp. WKF15]|uniref:hypothetical protein n=1 Tax=Cupriavidus sp. WKF15 TaxID=3032282 RepID=UPI0023E2B7F4|nr:hypothetical protein [Cupriavidus sp. WKF15]WER49938.1 hypothetical protein CupriaWKF_22790 [Cupriavidus sp. WKF15]
MSVESRKKATATVGPEAKGEKGTDGKLRSGKAGKKAAPATKVAADVAAVTDGEASSSRKAKKPSNGAAPRTDKPPKKPKVIRDSFTMPEYDYGKLADLKRKCLAGGVQVKKSELLRAGLLALEALPEKRLLSVVAQVEAVKTGRPAKS